MLDSLWQDLRYALKIRFKNRRVTAILVLCLALGIGPTTTVFSLVNTVLLKPVDVADPQRLVIVESVEGDRTSNLNYPESDWLNRHSDNLSGLTVMSLASVAVGLPQGSRMASCAVVGDNYFDVMGRPPMMGEVFHFDPETFPGRQAYLVLSHKFWKKQLNQDPQIVGKTLRVNGFDFEIKGVMAPSFTGSHVALVPDFWAPVKMIDQLRPDSTGRLNQWNHNWLMGFARLAPDSDMATAEQELRTLSQTFIEENEQADDLRSYQLSPFTNLAGFPEKEINMAVTMLFAVVSLVLLLSCVSVASILLTQGTERRQEIALRAALGATRRRIIRQLLVESVVLGLIAGAGALLVSMWCGDFLGVLIRQFAGSIELNLAIDYRVLAFTAGVSALAGLIFGLLPAMQASKPNLIKALKDQPLDRAGDRGTRILRNLFVAVQSGLSVILLIAAALFIRSLSHASQLDLGYESENLAVLPINLRLFTRTDHEAETFCQELQKALEAIPGIESVATARFAPLDRSISNTFIQAVDQDFKSSEERVRISWNRAGAGFFKTLDIEILEGRGFEPADMADEWRNLVISEAAAKRLFGNESAVGKQLAFPGGDTVMTVIGVAADVQNHRLREQSPPYFYAPMNPSGLGSINLIMRTGQNPETLLPAIKKTISDFPQDITLTGLTTIQELMTSALWSSRTLATLFGIMGAVALLLALTGVFGVVRYNIALRRREIGIRLALGCPPARLLRQLLRGGLVLVGIGAIAGLGAAFVLAKSMADLLVGIQPHDALVFIAIPILLLFIAFLALFPTAWRSVRGVPMSALRYE